ncbi:TPA: hypothetical protein KKX32_002279, partial [Legionella pneumophila]|nr:hypothetical protein [Legionella pneumophila]
IDFHQKLGKDPGTICHEAIRSFDLLWQNIDTRMTIVPGKILIRKIRDKIQKEYGVNLTDYQIIDEYKEDEIPTDLIDLIKEIDGFRIN